MSFAKAILFLISKSLVCVPQEVYIDTEDGSGRARFQYGGGVKEGGFNTEDGSGRARFQYRGWWWRAHGFNMEGSGGEVGPIQRAVVERTVPIRRVAVDGSRDSIIRTYRYSHCK